MPIADASQADEVWQKKRRSFRFPQRTTTSQESLVSCLMTPAADDILLTGSRGDNPSCAYGTIDRRQDMGVAVVDLAKGVPNL